MDPPVNILAEKEIGKKCAVAVPVWAFGSGTVYRAQDPLASLPRFSHMIYTDLRGHLFWIKIGKILPIGSTKCSLIPISLFAPQGSWPHIHILILKFLGQ